MRLKITALRTFDFVAFCIERYVECGIELLLTLLNPCVFIMRAVGAFGSFCGRIRFDFCGVIDERIYAAENSEGGHKPLQNVKRTLPQSCKSVNLIVQDYFFYEVSMIEPNTEMERAAEEISKSLKKISSGKPGDDYDSHIVKILDIVRYIFEERKYELKNIVDRWAENSAKYRKNNILKARRNLNKEDSSAFYWKKSALTSVTLGNAAGVVGLGSFLANSKELMVSVALVRWPFIFFLVGVVISAILPFTLWRISTAKIEEYESIVYEDSEHSQGRAAANSSSTSITWSIVSGYAMIAALICFAVGCAGVIQIILSTEPSSSALR